MRPFTRLVGTHQTALVTTRQDLPAAVLARHVDREHPDVTEAAERMAELSRQRDAVERRARVGHMETPTVRLPARVKNLYDGLFVSRHHPLLSPERR